MTPKRLDIDSASFFADPYPIYRELRDKAPIAYVPQLDSVLISRHEDIVALEPNIEVFSSQQPGGLMTRLMGENMMRKDGKPHRAERKVSFPAFSGRTVKQLWKQRFEADCAKTLDALARRDGCDLVVDFATIVSGDALRTVTGLGQVSAEDMDRWSQAMIEGIANYAGDPEPEAKCLQSSAEMNAAIEVAASTTSGASDSSLIALFEQSDFGREVTQANVKLAISGGQNETRDAIAGCIWALLQHPDERAKIERGEATWLDAFNEYVRWMSPIGMSPRRIAKSFVHGDVTFEEDQRAFFMFGAANRDDAVFENPNVFDISRDSRKHIAFGAGPHFCAGNWVSQSVVADVALPMLFERFPNLEIDSKAPPPNMRGWAFRGLDALPVVLNG